MRRFQIGFTIIELMVTLIVLAIVMAIVVPNFTGLINRNASLAIGEEMITAFNFARTEAIKLRQPVSICPSDDDATGCGDDWSNGWIVYTDGATETADSTTVSSVLRVWNDISSSAELAVSRGANAVDFVRFTGMGMLARVGGSTDSVSVTAQQKNCSGEAARNITIGLAGIISSKGTQCSEPDND